jgi:hypothetical protein
MEILTNSMFWSTVITTGVVISIIYLGYTHFKKDKKPKKQSKAAK